MRFRVVVNADSSLKKYALAQSLYVLTYVTETSTFQHPRAEKVILDRNLLEGTKEYPRSNLQRHLYGV